MNRIFSRVWSAPLGVWVVASELASRARPGSRKSGHTARRGLGTLLLLAASLATLDAAAQTVIDNEIATVPGSHPTPLVTDDLYIGSDHFATLTISETGSVVANRTARIGWNPAGSGTVVVEGGEFWTGAASTGYPLWLGYQGQGVLVVKAGGLARANTISIGSLPGGVGIIRVEGPGSALHSDFALLVGPQGSGTVQVLDGGLITTSRLDLSWSINPTGTSNVIVSGAGSTIRLAEFFSFGNGTGTLTISDGGTVDSLSGYIGRYTGGTGVATVIGNGSSLNLVEDLIVGHESYGELEVLDGGVTSIGGQLLLGTTATGNGAVRLAGQGALEIGGSDGIWSGEGAYSFDFDGGVLRIINDHFTTNIDAALTGTSTIETNGWNATWNGVLSGDGELVKSGAGVLTLSNGGNSYTGGTRIAQGGVEAHATGALGSGAVEIDQGFLVFDNAASAGNAEITNRGGSLLIRNNASLGTSQILNSTGEWTDGDGNTHMRYGFIQFQSETDPATGFPLDNGRLARGGDAHIVNQKGASISFANSGYLAENLTIENLDDSSISFNVRGDASQTTVHNGPDAAVHILGFHNLGMDGLGRVAGTLELGSLDGAGKVILGSNTLVLGGLGLDDHISGIISDTGEYAFNGTVTPTSLEADHGGHLEKVGPGMLTLTGENIYSGGTTVSGGTLAGNSVSLQGSIANHARLVFDQSFDGTFSGTLTGNGQFDKTGSSTLVFNGDGSGFHGMTTVQAGTLIVGGDTSFSHVEIGGTVHVNAGATLGGHGKIGGMDASGGVTGGNSIGILTVEGDARFRSGSTYLADTDVFGNSDRLQVGGAVTIDPGSTLQIVGSEGRWQPFTNYTLIRAGNGVTGQFDDVYVNFVFLDALLDYSGGGVALTLQRNILDFASIALSDNQRGTATAVERLGWGNPLYDAVLVLDAPTAIDALDQLAGEIHAGTRSALQEQSHDLRDAAWARGNPNQKPGFWVQAIGGWGSIAADGNAPRVKQDRIGLVMGMDRLAGESGYAGVMIGYGDGELSSQTNASSVDVRTLHAGAYGGLRQGRYFVDAGAGYSRHRLDTRRDVAFDLFSDRLEGRYDTLTLQVFARAGMALTRVLDGFVDIAHVRMDADDLRESGGSAALQVDGDDDGATYASLGMRLDLPVANGDTRITGSMAWRHRLGGDDPGFTITRFDGSDPFVVDAPAISRSALVAQAAASWRIGSNGRLSLAYSGIGGDARDQRVRATYSMSF